MTGRAVVVWTTLAVVLMGVVLPAVMKVLPPVSHPRRMFRVDASKVLCWVDALFLPPGTSDAVRIPANVATTALWGLLVGVLIVRLRSNARPPKE